MTEECIYMGRVACLTHHSGRRDEEQDRCDYARMIEAEAAIERVRELHKGTPECAHCAGVTGLPDGAKVDTCDACCEVMPCPTIRALDGDA